MDRYNWYFRRVITEADLDTAFANVEAALDRYATDLGVTGLVVGGAVTPGAGLTVNVATGAVYDQTGQRTSWTGPVNVDMSLDENLASTAVGSPGNEKQLALFVEFVRTTSDPHIDGNGNTVDFQENEDYVFNVVQGAEAAIGAATPPALRSDQILIADIRIQFGDTSFTSGDIDQLSRTEYAFRLDSSVPLRTAKDALEHLDTLIATLNGSQVDFTAGISAWADATGLVATSVQSAVDEVVNTLGGASGALKVGFDPTGSTIISTDVETALKEVATLAGLTPTASQITNVPAGNIAATDVQAAINELDTEKQASSITLTTPDWANGDTVSASTVLGALNEIIDDIGDNSGVDGAARVGFSTIVLWKDGVVLGDGLLAGSLVTSNVSTGIESIVNDLADATIDDGAGKIGYEDISGGGNDNVADALDDCLRTNVAQTVTGAKTFGVGKLIHEATSTNEVVRPDALVTYANLQVNILRLAPRYTGGVPDWQVDASLGAGGDVLAPTVLKQGHTGALAGWLAICLPAGCQVGGFRVRYLTGSGQNFYASFWRDTPDTAADATKIDEGSATSTTLASLTVTFANITIDPDQIYFMALEADADAGSAARVYSLDLLVEFPASAGSGLRWAPMQP